MTKDECFGLGFCLGIILCAAVTLVQQWEITHRSPCKLNDFCKDEIK